MTKRYSGLVAGLGSLPVQPPEAGKGVNSFVHVHKQHITLAAQAIGDIEVMARLPAGQLFSHGFLITDTSLGSATISLGNLALPAKYKAAATLTSTNTQVFFGDVAAYASDLPLTADEEVLLTVGTAALPGAGNLWMFLFASKP